MLCDVSDMEKQEAVMIAILHDLSYSLFIESFGMTSYTVGSVYNQRTTQRKGT